MERVILAVDAGGTSIKYSLLSKDTKTFLTGQKFYDMPSFGTKEELLLTFANVFADAKEQCSARGGEIARAAFSVPGPFDCTAGVSMMTHKWRALKNLPLRHAFQEMGIFSAKTEYTFLHDVHAFLVGEKCFGRAKGYENVMAVIIGTGLGVGLWEQGGIRFAKDGGALYSIFGRPCGEGILEDYVSGRGLQKAYQEKCGRLLNAKEIAAETRNGDGAAAAVYEQMGRLLGGHIADIVKQHKIQCIVIGGRISLAFDLFGEALRACAGGVEIYASDMLESAAMLGAAVWGDRVFDV